MIINVYINDPGHMTKLASRAINSKVCKNRLCQSLKAYEFLI